ncbi:MAG: ribulokinase [Spirochaetales bacterium]
MQAQMSDLVLGIDFGTDSCRVVLINGTNGQEVASYVAYYPRWKKGLYCDPRKDQYRQHPLDYIETLEEAVRGCVAKGGKGAGERVRGIGIDTTGSTPIAADERGTPLSLLPEYSEDPDAMFVLWKDHTSVAEALSLTQHAKSWGGVDYTRFIGGVYSAEWFWAKILHLFKTNKRIKEKAVTFVEHCDWMPALLTGNSSLKNLKRSRCAMGHKAMWHKEWDGYPSAEYFKALDPELVRIRETLGKETWTSDVKAGELSEEWAKRLGLKAGIPVAVGAYDAHMGAAGAGVRPGVMVKVIGTSTCDMTVGPLPKGDEHPVAGICGQVDGSILPGYLGYEAGQSAFGDVYAWYRSLLLWPVYHALAQQEGVSSKAFQHLEENLLPQLEKAASEIPVGDSTLLSLDWMNGRRTPFANQFLKGAITGISLGTDAPRVYRALIEGTAFGAKAIVDRFQEEGVEISRIVGIGGVAKKSTLVMQILSDVLQAPIDVLSNDQTVAIGAAMFGSVVGGLYPSAEKAQEVFVPSIEKTYYPQKALKEPYHRLYEQYRKLGQFIEDNLTPIKE